MGSTNASVPVIVGNSHAEVILASAAREGFPLRGWAFGRGPQPPWSEDGTELHHAVQENLQTGRVFSIVGRSHHEERGLLQHPVPFDFVLPEAPDLPLTPGAQILPYEAVRETLLKIMTFDFQIMSAVWDLAGDRMVHILTQPPLKNLEAIEKFPAWDYGDAAISPAHLRLKLYRIYASATRQWCAKRGVPVIDPPFEGLTDDGFLRDEYLSNATHANVDYGVFWLRRMEQWL
jgi:hypothetical protein